jgi:Mrp family chromosome partitioning ATPase
MPVGSLPPNPTELLLSDRFRELIGKLREEYDYIFLNCPPIDIVADSSIITSVVDMTVFVIRAGLMDKRLIPVIDEIYASGKYSHMAFLLNGVDLSNRQKYGYGRKGGYGYGYGYGYGNQA